MATARGVDQRATAPAGVFRGAGD